MKIIATFLTPTIFLLALTSSPAGTILIDWSTAAIVPGLTGSGGVYAGQASSDGKYWNSLGLNSNVADPGTDLAATSLIDAATGLDTGWDVAVNLTYTGSSSKVGAAFGGTGINGPAGADPFDEANATTDGIFANNNSVGTAEVTFTGLSASTQYNFSMIGGRASSGGNGTITVLQGTSGSSSYTLFNSGALLNFTVTSTAGGVIQLEFSEASNDTSSSSNATWNAMSLSDSINLIQSFTATPSSIEAGSQATLSWTASGYDTLVLNPGAIDADALSTNGSGSTSVTPGETTTYTLTASKSGQQSSLSLVVNVTPSTPDVGIVPAQRSLWTEWYRPVDQPVFSTVHGNNHDAVIFHEPTGSTYKYYLIISHEPSNAFLWGTNTFSWNSADWTLISGNYQINGEYEYDDGVKVGDTYYLYENGKVLTYTGDLLNSSGNWTQAGTYPKAQCDDIGVFYEDGVFHIFGENGTYPNGYDGLRLSHYTSTTGIGNWTLVDNYAVDPNPDGGTTYGVGDATIIKVDGIYYLFCDIESLGNPYKVTAWQSTDINQPFEYLGIALEARSGETDDWDNHRIQDADILYVPELKRFIMVCNMMDTDGIPGGYFPGVGGTRVVGMFYSNITDGGFDAYIQGFSGLTGADALFDADPDDDGASNGEEYAGGTLPDDASSFPLLQFTLLEDAGAQYPAIIFDRVTVDPLVIRFGEISSGSLAGGSFTSTGGMEIQTSASDIGAFYERVVFRSSSELLPATSQFLRIRTDTVSTP